MTPTQQIATTILEQLGGRRFVMMTGARQLTTLPETTEVFGGLGFRIPMACKDGSRTWKITLTPADTYTIETFSMKGQPKTKLTDVYCDMLVSTFERVTGLAAHF